MCGSGGDSSKYARRQDVLRNRAIAQGKVQLEQIFAPLEGSEYRLVSPDVAGISREEYMRQRLARTPKPDSDLVPYDEWKRKTLAYYGAQYDAKMRDAGSYEKVEGQTTPIWEQQQRAYLQYARPELGRQQAEAREDLGFALQRQGVGSSSIAGDRWAEQLGDFARAEQDIAERGREVGATAKADVARQKQALLTMLSSTGDAGAAAESARLAVGSLRDAPRVEPLGVLFQNTTAGLAGGLNAYQQGKQVGRYNNIVYGGDPDRGSGRIVR